MAAPSKRAARRLTRGTTPAAPQPDIAAARGRRAGGVRWPVVDLLRGTALVAMIVYHFCFDLAHFGWLQADFVNDARWVWFRRPILGSFLFLAGFSLALADAQGEAGARFWRRIGVIAAAAALVSIGSFFMFPRSFIYFGVLHAIAVMSVLTRTLLRAAGGGRIAGAALMTLGIAVLALGNLVQHPLFDLPALHWIGLMTFKPLTEDYVPLFPWMGMLLMGAGIGSFAAGTPSMAARLAAARVPPALGWVEWMGRHSLAIYLLHQPLLLGAMMAARML